MTEENAHSLLQPQLHRIVNVSELEACGIPDGAMAWYYYLAPAMSFIQSIVKTNSNRPMLVAWDKPDKKITNMKKQSRSIVVKQRNDPGLSSLAQSSLNKKQTKKQSPKKAYGVFSSHSVFWEFLSKLSEDRRFAYEIIEAGRPCKCYWDIEFSIHFEAETSDLQKQKKKKARDDVRTLMKLWIARLKQEVCYVFNSSYSHPDQIIACVLDGTREICLHDKEEDDKDIADDNQGDDHSSVDVVVTEAVGIKFSYHVILVNVIVENNQSRSFQLLKKRIPSLWTLLCESTYGSQFFGPSKDDTGAPDLCVWKDNQIFRCLSCSKRGGSTPLSFADDSLNETREPMDTFLTYIPNPSEILKCVDCVVSQQEIGSLMTTSECVASITMPTTLTQSKNGSSNNSGSSTDPKTTKKITRKRKKVSEVSDISPVKANKKRHGDSTTAHQNDDIETANDTENMDGLDDLHMVHHFLTKYPKEMKAIHKEVQTLINAWDHSIVVEKLVRARANLRYQCKVTDCRKCIFSTEVHYSNNPLIWLDAPQNVSDGQLSNYYLVYYNCQSSECRCDGVIGELYKSASATSVDTYKHKKIFPALIRNPRGPLHSKLNTTQAEVRSNLILASNSTNVSPLAENMQNTTSLFRVSDDAFSDYNDEEPEEVSKEPIQVTTSSCDEFHRPGHLLQLRIEGYGWSLKEQQMLGIENSYQYVKRRIEKTHCKIQSPNVVFIRFTVDPTTGKIDEYHHYSHDNMAKTIKNVFYYRKNEPDESPTPARFFPYWTDDPEIRCYESIKFDPTPPLFQATTLTSTTTFAVVEKRKYLNVWPGFKAEYLQPLLPEIDPIETWVEPIRHHVLFVIANNNTEHGEWILDWMASIIQRPHIRTEVPLVISGKQGVGKGIIFDFFRHSVLGNKISNQIQHPGQDLFSRFANKHVDKIFLQIDEGEGMAKYADQMKNLVTAKTINYEIKGISPLIADNYINIVITTNHERPVLVESSDRRYALFKASDVYLDNDKYYSDLAHHLDHPKTGRAFYEFLNQRDISKYNTGNFQKSRPVTEYYVQARNVSIPILQRFLSALINTSRYFVVDPQTQLPDNNNVHECTCALMFKDFVKFQECGKFQSSMTQSIFAMKLKNIKGITKVARRGIHSYLLEYTLLREYLMKNNEFDDDAILD